MNDRKSILRRDLPRRAVLNSLIGGFLIAIEKRPWSASIDEASAQNGAFTSQPGNRPGNNHRRRKRGRRHHRQRGNRAPKSGGSNTPTIRLLVENQTTSAIGLDRWTTEGRRCAMIGRTSVAPGDTASVVPNKEYAAAWLNGDIAIVARVTHFNLGLELAHGGEFSKSSCYLPGSIDLTLEDVEVGQTFEHTLGDMRFVFVREPDFGRHWIVRVTIHPLLAAG